MAQATAPILDSTKGDLGGSKLLLCNLIPEPSFASRKSLL